MPDETLLELETERVVLRLRGPRGNRFGVVDSTGRTTGRMAVTAIGDSVTRCLWIDTSGGVHEALCPVGPMLFEETSYDLEISASSGEVEVRAPEAALVSRLHAPASHPNVRIGTINFRQQVGRTRLDVRIDGLDVLLVEIEVFPAKIDYEADYLVMLDEISGISRALAYEFLRATHASGVAESSTEQTALEWLLLLRAEFERIERAIAYINRHPVRRLVRNAGIARVDRIRRPHGITLGAIRAGRGQGRWITSRNGYSMRERLPTTNATETLDTPEHAWLRRELGLVQHELARLSGIHAARRRKLLDLGWSTEKLEADLATLENLQRRTARLVTTEVLEEARTRVPPHFSSLTLMRQPGYGDAYRSLLVLRSALYLRGAVFEVPLKDISRLYEMWCFLALADSLRRRFAECDLSSLIAVESNGLTVALETGRAQRVRFKDGSRECVLTYAPTYRGLTGDQKPDIVLELNDERTRLVAFDAKYRLVATDDYVSRFGTPGPPPDAVGALHRYRDAITVSHAGLATRPVVRGVALFPLGALAASGFATSRWSRALDEFGVGALPFLPGSRDHVESWLDWLLTAPLEELDALGTAFL